MNLRSLIFVLAAIAAPVPAAQAQTAAPAAPVDPARLAMAERVVTVVFPKGFYRQAMGASFDQMMAAMTDAMGDIPIDDLVRLSGASAATVKALGPAKLKEVMAIYDPRWQERMRLGIDAMRGSMVDVMESMEPSMRSALARAYAREFSTADLAAVEAFFATPAGRHYAEKSLLMFMDPEMAKSMGEMMPKLMEQMPELVAKAEAATKHIPPARTNKDLTPAERAKLAALLGVDASTLEKGADDPAS